MINDASLKEALSKNGFQITTQEADRIIANLDSSGNHQINYTEFLIATLEVKQLLSREMIQALFRYFDTDHSGVISSQDLRSAFRKTGKLLASTEVKNIMRQYAPPEGQGITLEKFKRALQPVRFKLD